MTGAVVGVYAGLMRGWVVGLLGLVWLAAGVARAADDAPTWREHLTVTASLRTRGELVDWFEPAPGTAPNGAERYAFFASQLRLGARLVFPHVEAGVELQDTRLVGLPSDATLAPPAGSLGPGALYYLYGHDTTQGEPFVKQGFVTLRRSGLALTLGRFEYRDGLEALPADATLAIVKRTRVAERLVGPFDFHHAAHRSASGPTSAPAIVRSARKASPRRRPVSDRVRVISNGITSFDQSEIAAS